MLLVSPEPLLQQMEGVRVPLHLPCQLRHLWNILSIGHQHLVLSSDLQWSGVARPAHLLTAVHQQGEGGEEPQQDKAGTAPGPPPLPPSRALILARLWPEFRVVSTMSV